MAVLVSKEQRETFNDFVQHCYLMAVVLDRQGHGLQRSSASLEFVVKFSQQHAGKILRLCSCNKQA